MIIAHSYLEVPKENRNAYFQEHLEKVGTPSRVEKGCYQYEYVFSAERDDLMIIIERWECQADMDAHLASEHCKASPGLREKYGVSNYLNKYEVK